MSASDRKLWKKVTKVEKQRQYRVIRTFMTLCGKTIEDQLHLLDWDRESQVMVDSALRNPGRPPGAMSFSSSPESVSSSGTDLYSSPPVGAGRHGIYSK